MQIFNFINARRINDERNVFEGMILIYKLINFFTRPLQKSIVSNYPLHYNSVPGKIKKIKISSNFKNKSRQAILISHGSLAFHVYPWYDHSTGAAGLNLIQWAICIGFGSGSLIVRFLLMLVSETKCLQVIYFSKKIINNFV